MTVSARVRAWQAGSLGAPVPSTLRNPLYHWTHLELKRYFGIDELLDERSTPGIWDRANALLAADELSAQGILGRFRAKAVRTTDDPTDDLAWHKAIRDSGLQPTTCLGRTSRVGRCPITTTWWGR